MSEGSLRPFLVRRQAFRKLKRQVRLRSDPWLCTVVGDPAVMGGKARLVLRLARLAFELGLDIDMIAGTCPSAGANSSPLRSGGRRSRDDEWD